MKVRFRIQIKWHGFTTLFFILFIKKGREISYFCLRPEDFIKAAASFLVRNLIKAAASHLLFKTDERPEKNRIVYLPHLLKIFLHSAVSKVPPKKFFFEQLWSSSKLEELPLLPNGFTRIKAQRLIWSRKLLTTSFLFLSLYIFIFPMTKLVYAPSSYQLWF